MGLILNLVWQRCVTKFKAITFYYHLKWFLKVSFQNVGLIDCCDSWLIFDILYLFIIFLEDRFPLPIFPYDLICSDIHILNQAVFNVNAKLSKYIYTSLLYFNKLIWVLVDIGKYELALLPIWSRHQSRDHLVSFLFCYNVTLIISNCFDIVLLIRHATTKSRSGFRGVSY